MRLSHLVPVLAVAFAGACASLAPSHRAASQPYQVAVRNETGAEITVEYCDPAGACSRLGDLGIGAAASFAVPASAAQSRLGNRIVLLGKSYFPGGYRQMALQPVHLSRPGVEVTLRRREARESSTGMPSGGR